MPNQPAPTPQQAPPARIALIHATALAVEPIASAFARHWPQAQRMNLLDDSLSVDHAAAHGQLTPAMVQRFDDLAHYARRCGCSGILFTCSAFGAAIEAAGRSVGLPTLKPNEAMFEEALMAQSSRTSRIGLIATFEASIAPMAGELQALARERGLAIDLRTLFVPQAMQDLAEGRATEHNRKIAEAALALADCNIVLLAQFSMAAAQPDVQARLPCPVLSSPDCAVLSLKQKMPHV